MTYYRESQKVIVAKEHNTASGRFAIFLVAKGEEPRRKRQRAGNSNVHKHHALVLCEYELRGKYVRSDSGVPLGCDRGSGGRQ